MNHGRVEAGSLVALYCGIAAGVCLRPRSVWHARHCSGSERENARVIPRQMLKDAKQILVRQVEERQSILV